MIFKLVVSMIVGIFVSVGFFGYFFAWATHSYAKNFGFRVPVGGTDYEFLANQIARPQILFIAAVLGGLLFWGTRWITEIPKDITKGLVSSELKTREYSAALFLTGEWLKRFESKYILLFILALSAAFSGLTWTLGTYIYEPYICGSFLAPLPCTNVTEASLSLGVFTAYVGLLLWRPEIRWSVLGIVPLVFVSGVLRDHFDPYIYAKYLRIHGYGGGLPITLRLVGAQTRDVADKAGYLLLRTNTTIFLYDYNEARVDEYSLQQVERLSYVVGGFSSMSFKLPPRAAIGRTSSK